MTIKWVLLQTVAVVSLHQKENKFNNQKSVYTILMSGSELASYSGLNLHSTVIRLIEDAPFLGLTFKTSKEM